MDQDGPVHGVGDLARFRHQTIALFFPLNVIVFYKTYIARYGAKLM